LIKIIIAFLSEVYFTCCFVWVRNLVLH
jgi:hypothetical protein